MTRDDVPSWARAAAMIEGITLSDVQYDPCERCGRQIPPCVHPRPMTRSNGSIICFACATLLHGRPLRREHLLCSVCKHLELQSIQEVHEPLDITVEEE